MMIPDEIRKDLEWALVYMASMPVVPTEEQIERYNRLWAWLDSQPAGEWVPVEEEVKYTIGDQIMVRVGPYSVSARWKGHGGGSFSFPDHLRLCRRTTRPD